MIPVSSGCPLVAAYGSDEIGKGDFKKGGLKAAAAAKGISQKKDNLGIPRGRKMGFILMEQGI